MEIERKTKKRPTRPHLAEIDQTDRERERETERERERARESESEGASICRASGNWPKSDAAGLLTLVIAVAFLWQGLQAYFSVVSWPPNGW